MKAGNSSEEEAKKDNMTKLTTKTSLYGKQHHKSVRQIWLGGLPPDITEKVLYKYFFIFGEIENIELRPDKSFAFIKYYTVKAATHAADWANTTTVFKEPLKVSFSDQTRRRHVLGDKQNYSLNENNCKTLVVLYSKNAGALPSSEYGYIRGLYIKEMPQQITQNFPFLRSSILVDYDKPEEAQDARSDLFENDAFGAKRKDLGDKECQINFALPKYLAEAVAPEKNDEALEKFAE